MWPPLDQHPAAEWHHGRRASESMRGRITRLIEDQQFGSIIADNGAEYLFFDVSILGAAFSELHVGARVTFTPLDGDGFVRQASAVRAISN